MQATDLSRFIEVAVSEVLEGMCFTSIEGESTGAEEVCPAEWIYGSLDFVGGPSGSFAVALPPETAAMIASNFLGEEEHMLDSQQIGGVVGELANMMCGSLLAHLNTEKVFTLSPPWFGRYDQSEPIAEQHRSRTFVLDEGLISTWLNIRDLL